MRFAVRSAGDSRISPGSIRAPPPLPPVNAYHHTVLRMPHLPHVPLMVAMRTAQRIATGTVTVTFPITLGRDDLDGTLDDAPHLRQGLLHQAFDLGKRLGRLHPVGAYPLETFRKHLLHHPTDKGVDIHAFPLHSLRLMRAIMGGDALTIITVDPSQGEQHLRNLRRKGVLPS